MASVFHGAFDHGLYHEASSAPRHPSHVGIIGPLVHHFCKPVVAVLLGLHPAAFSAERILHQNPAHTLRIGPLEVDYALTKIALLLPTGKSCTVNFECLRNLPVRKFINGK